MNSNLVLLCVLFCASLTLSKRGKVRNYYIQAEDIDWDFAPGIDPETENEKKYLEQSDERIGKVYKKCVYRRYTDGDFDKRHSADDRSEGSRWEHLGTLGPVLRAVVGDTVYIHFKNKCDFPASVHVHGMKYAKKHEGFNYLGKNYDGGYVEPGHEFTYEWHVEARSGPGPNDGNSIGWLYHSHVDEPKDTNTGLVGMVIVGKDEESCPDGFPKDVDREFVLLYTIVDENVSHYLEENMKKMTNPKKKGKKSNSKQIAKIVKDLDFIESNKKHSINSYLFFTLPGVEMTEGEHIRWYTAALGNEQDLHTAHWHGDTLLWSGSTVDVIDVTPAVVKVADMWPDNPGRWMMHCHVNDHLEAGMDGIYTVNHRRRSHY